MKQCIQQALMILLIISVTFLSCQKEINESSKQNDATADLLKNKDQGHLKQTKTFPSDGVVSWINLQLLMNKAPLPAGTAGQATDRCQAYCGIALYESVVPGMPAYQTLSGQLTDFPAMPKAEPGKAYHWAASANAALAEMNRKLFPTTANANKAAMNALESTLEATYAGEVSAEVLQRSIAFGREVATRVFAWAATDGSANVNPPYVPEIGIGFWVPTAATPPIGAYTHQRRMLVPGVANGTELVPLPAFSTTVGSPYYNMVKQVYDASATTATLTANQKAMADYFKDVPGYTPGGSYVALMMQALDKTDPMLDMAALTYVKVGLAQYEATNVLFIDKYKFKVMRPVTYIRAYIDPAWSPYLPTPNHPEFPGGHNTTGGAVLAMMSNMFGEDFHITLHTYDYLGYPPRSYTSFTQLINEISDSRFYGGLHYKETQEKSTAQGAKVAQNILGSIQFLKD